MSSANYAQIMIFEGYKYIKKKEHFCPPKLKDRPLKLGTLFIFLDYLIGLFFYLIKQKK